MHDAAHVPASENPLTRLVRANCCHSVSQQRWWEEGGRHIFSSDQGENPDRALLTFLKPPLPLGEGLGEWWWQGYNREGMRGHGPRETRLWSSSASTGEMLFPSYLGVLLFVCSPRTEEGAWAKGAGSQQAPPVLCPSAQGFMG